MNFRYYYLFLIVFGICLTGTVEAQSPVYLTSVEAPLKFTAAKPEVAETFDENLSKAQQRKKVMTYLKGLDAGDKPFTAIDDVISRDELSAMSESYKQISDS